MVGFVHVFPPAAASTHHVTCCESVHSDHKEHDLFPPQTSCAAQVWEWPIETEECLQLQFVQSVSCRWRWSYSAGSVGFFSISTENSCLHVNLFWKATLPVGNCRYATAAQLESNQWLLEAGCVLGMLHSHLPGCHDNSAQWRDLIGCGACCSTAVNMCFSQTSEQINHLLEVMKTEMTLCP